MSTGATFNQYIIPKVPISSSAENVTKIIMTSDKDMLVNGMSVDAVPLKRALHDFFKWLDKFENTFLVAHNGRRFDFIVLTAACRSCGAFNEYLLKESGLVDTLPVFKHVFSNQNSYKQEDLALNLLTKNLQCT